jgi:hypothetical protein
MKTTFIIVVVALTLSLLPASALITEAGGGIIYGETYAFNLKAPKGWIFDNESGVQQGLPCVLYPKGSTWQDSPVIAYARSRARTNEVQTADDAAKAAVDDFHARGNPNYVGERVKTIKTKNGAEGVIYHFSGDRHGNYEAMVYFVEAKTINVVILNSRNRKAFEAALPAFDEIAQSYIFMGDSPLKGGRPETAPTTKQAR